MGVIGQFHEFLVVLVAADGKGAIIAFFRIDYPDVPVEGLFRQFFFRFVQRQFRIIEDAQPFAAAIFTRDGDQGVVLYGFQEIGCECVMENKKIQTNIGVQNGQFGFHVAVYRFGRK